MYAIGTASTAEYCFKFHVRVTSTLPPTSRTAIENSVTTNNVNSLKTLAERPDNTLDFSRPGKPTDNPFIESFNGSFRDECLNLNWFLSLDDAQQKIEAWRVDYNEYRPHQSLNDRTPQEFVSEHHQAEFL
jgi:hypothetical protein